MTQHYVVMCAHLHTYGLYSLSCIQFPYSIYIQPHTLASALSVYMVMSMLVGVKSVSMRILVEDEVHTYSLCQ